MKVRARTEYTKNLLLKVARFAAVSKRSQIIAYIIIELAMVGMVVFGFYSAIAEGEAFALAIVFAVIFPLLVPLTILILPVFMAKESKGLIGAVITYEFNDDEVIISSSIQDAVHQAKMNYSSLCLICETKDVFYLYISKRQALILRKSDIFEGSLLELRILFLKNIPDGRYVVRGMKKALIGITDEVDDV